MQQQPTYSFVTTLPDLDAGVFEQKVSSAVQKDIDIGKHPLLKQCYELCLAIGAGLELTEAVTKVSALMVEIEKITDRLAGYERADRDINEALNMGDGTYKP